VYADRNAHQRVRRRLTANGARAFCTERQ
jgi:hypothetical protein